MYDLLVIVYLDCREEVGTWRIAARDAVSFPEWGTEMPVPAACAPYRGVWDESWGTEQPKLALNWMPLRARQQGNTSLGFW